MAKKKKTLPKDFDEMLKAGDISALKAVFDSCELDARGGYGKGTALHFYGITEELMRWLVEQGADVNAEDDYGNTPLNHQINTNLIALLLDLGAKIDAPDRYGNTPLHTAAGFYRVNNVRLLIERGANIHANSEQTPLAYALVRCANADIASMAEIAELLLGAGAKITADMKERVKRIGEQFEFHRGNFNKDYIAETDAGLSKLYSLFGLEAIARRQMHDGTSPITVKSTAWEKQHAELWELLIPSHGAAKTVQGEVIRITGRVSDELQRNGGANWNADYRKMLDALLRHVASGASLSESELSEAAALVADIRPNGEADGDYRLCELAVKWVLKNPNPVPLNKPDYKR
jgi:hypothetical protein